MKTVRIVMGACVLIAVGWVWLSPAKPPTPSWQSGSSVRSTVSGLWRLQWGYENNRVKFLAFVHSNSQRPAKLVMVAGPLPTRQILLAVPGQEPTALPTEVNIFEFVDGKLNQQNIPVTVTQAKEFCAAKRSAYTVDKLLTFLEEQEQ